jgi:selenoprotein W-related protein
LRFKQDIASLKLIPAGGGVFEVVVNGEKIYSKKETGKFPEPAAIVKQVRGKLQKES